MEKERPLDQTQEETTCEESPQYQEPVDPPDNQGGGSNEVPGNPTTLSDF